MKGNPGKCLPGSVSILPTETFPPLAVWAPGLLAGVFDLMSRPAYGVTKRSQSANLHRKLQSLREGMEAFSLSFPFLLCSWSFDAICKHFSGIYNICSPLRNMQDYFHYWDWQAASCQARTGVFFSISLNELPSFGSTHWPLTKETYYSKEDITWGADTCAPKFL